MVDVMELPKARINASMLAQFIDQPVCFVGRLEKVRALTALGFLGGGAPWPSGWRRVEERKHHCAPNCFIFSQRNFLHTFWLLARGIAKFSNALRSSVPPSFFT